MVAGLRGFGNDKGKQVVCPTSEVENRAQKRLVRDRGCSTEPTQTSCSCPCACACAGVVLPGEIIERILSLLPSTCLFKLRSVCKDWNRLLSSPSFLKTCTPDTLGRPLFFFFTDDWNRSVAAYKFETKRWFKFPFGCVPHLTDVRASAGNLVLCGNLVGRPDGFVDDRYVVCNPITKEWIQLPQPACDPKPATSPVLALKQLSGSSPSSFHVIQATTVEDHDHTRGNGHFTLLQGYSSDTQQWSNVGRIWHAVLASMAWCNHTLYCLSTSSHVLFSSRAESFRWQSVHLPPVRRGSAKLLEWNGHVILPGICSVSDRLRVWMLDQTTYEWARVGHIDAHVMHGGFSAVLCGDVVVFVGNKDVTLLTFNLHDKSWRRIRACPFIERTGDMSSSPPCSWSCKPSLSPL